MDTKEIFHWPPLESDPEIFTSYANKLGLSKDYIFEEVYSLDEETVNMLQSNSPYAVIVNYERNKESKKSDYDTIDMPFYMLQKGKLDNACGIIAAVHSIGNNLDSLVLDEKSVLSEFFLSAKNKSPSDIADLLENNIDFQTCHKEYSSQGQSRQCENQDEVKNHFVSFVIRNNTLVELDGTKGKPLIIEKNIDSSLLLIKTVEEIKKRLENNEITEKLSVMTLNHA